MRLGAGVSGLVVQKTHASSRHVASAHFEHLGHHQASCCLLKIKRLVLQRSHMNSLLMLPD